MRFFCFFCLHTKAVVVLKGFESCSACCDGLGEGFVSEDLEFEETMNPLSKKVPWTFFVRNLFFLTVKFEISRPDTSKIW